MSIATQQNCPLPSTTIKASYEQVVADQGLFTQTLEDLHKSLGTKFMVPTIGGKPLDLHFLFVEVTSRGGLQKVISDRKWREVIGAFAFPPSVTNASFVLRKYYISLLQNYEQVYFFQNRDCQLLSSDAKAISVSEALQPHKENMSTKLEGTEDNHEHDAKAISVSEALQPHKENMSTKLEGTEDNHKHEDSPLRVGSVVKGKINGKFEDGYFVTANFGSESFNGVLYHVPLKPSGSQNYSKVVSHTRARKRLRREVDPSNLKPEMGSYNLFFAEHYSKLRPVYSGKEKVIFKHINDLWDKLTESERKSYEERNKERC